MHTSVVVVDSTEPSYQGVTVYYVGFNLDGSQSGGFTSVGDSSGSLTTISRHSTTTVTEIESFHRQASTQLTQNGTMVKNANGAWGWSVTGNGTSTTSGDWLVGSITGFNGTARTVWNKNGTSLTATSSLQSTTTEITGGGWQANNSFEFIGGNWTQTGTNLTKTVVYDRTLQASGSSGLTTVGGCLSLSMSASRTDNSTLGAYYGHTVSGSGDVTVWRHNGTSTVGWTTSANLTSGSGCSTSSEYFSSNFSESLTTNSTWSQSGGGPAIGANMAIYSRNSIYSGGSGGGYGGSSSYSGGQNWTWSDPNLSTYDAHALSEIRITPNGPAEIGPVMFRTAPSPSFVMPLALVEDTDVAAVENSDENAIGGFLWSLVPGKSLYDAYQDYQKGNYLSAGLNGVFGAADLLSVGSMARVRGGLKLFVGVMKVRIKDVVVDAVAKEAGNAVAERYGPEAGFVTRMIVSAKLSKDVSQQNKTQLGFANNGSGNDFQKAIEIPKTLPDRLVITGKSFGKKMKERVLELGLDPSDPQVRQKFKSRIERIFLNVEEKRVNFYRGQGKNGLEGVVLLYRRGHDVLVLSLEGNFITLLVGGINSQRWISGVVLS